MNDAKSCDWNPRSDAVQRDPLGAYDRMRETCAIAYSDPLGWSLFRYDDVLHVLRNPAVFSNEVSRHISVPNGMDPPRHTIYRRLIEPYFSQTHMAAFEPICRAVADELLDSVRSDRTVECMNRVATHFAVRAQCAFLDWPRSLHEVLRTWMLENQAAVFAENREKLARLAREFSSAIRSIVHGRSDTANDITARLMREQVHGRPLEEDELVSILRNWTAGEVGTLSAAVGILLRYLAEHPGLQQRLRDEPHRLPYAIDEILRIEGPLISNRRVNIQPVEFHGRRIAKGQRITIIWPAANRDARVFDEPISFRWDRDQSKNLLYGAGIHVCPGAPLARLELRVLLEQLLSATDRLDLTADPPRPANYPVGGYACIPLSIAWR